MGDIVTHWLEHGKQSVSSLKYVPHDSLVVAYITPAKDVAF